MTTSTEVLRAPADAGVSARPATGILALFGATLFLMPADTPLWTDSFSNILGVFALGEVTANGSPLEAVMRAMVSRWERDLLAGVDRSIRRVARCESLHVSFERG